MSTSEQKAAPNAPEDAMIRMNCIQLAMQAAQGSPDRGLDLAKAMYDFIKTGEVHKSNLVVARQAL